MRRLFWLSMGITIGVLVVRKLSRVTARLTPGGIAGSLSEALTDLALSVRDFITDVRETMTDREAQLRADTGLDGSLGNQGKASE